MKIIYWIGIDDHADKWTIAQYRGDEERPSKEFELVPDDKGWRRLLSHLKGVCQRCNQPTTGRPDLRRPSR